MPSNNYISRNTIKGNDIIHFLLKAGFIYGATYSFSLIFRHHDFKTDHELFLIDNQTLQFSDCFTKQELEQWAKKNEICAKYMAINKNGLHHDGYRK